MSREVFRYGIVDKIVDRAMWKNGVKNSVEHLERDTLAATTEPRYLS
jgi:hypothetical protein